MTSWTLNVGTTPIVELSYDLSRKHIRHDYLTGPELNKEVSGSVPGRVSVARAFGFRYCVARQGNDPGKGNPELNNIPKKDAPA